MTEETCTLREFATALGASLPYVTRLHRDGRLVMTPEGRVCVDASLERLAGEEAGNAASAPPAGADVADVQNIVPTIPSFTDSRARREHFLALAAERDYRLSMRELAPSALLEEILARAGTRIGALLDGISGAVRLRYPKLTAADLGEIQSVITKTRNIIAGMRLQDLFEGDASDSAVASKERPELPVSASSSRHEPQGA